ncbi:MAG: hypothetical protein FJX68_05585 [Alphaproteobacteria bacterium]|nr:hypothetical protein [Alphaproteobacteria bacterium]
MSTSARPTGIEGAGPFAAQNEDRTDRIDILAQQEAALEDGVVASQLQVDQAGYVALAPGRMPTPQQQRTRPPLAGQWRQGRARRLRLVQPARAKASVHGHLPELRVNLAARAAGDCC